MSKITFCQTSVDTELYQILDLQQKNHYDNVTREVQKKEGFLTVKHDFDLLKKMHEQQPHIIAKDGDEVVGYALSMLREIRNEIEVLRPMFDEIDKLISPEENYLVMGQICVDVNYRRKGIFRGLYHKMKEDFSTKYDKLITEVDQKNLRSIQAHKAVGFEDLCAYESQGVFWDVVVWQWSDK